MQKVWYSSSSKGFSSVEVLLAATLFGVIVVGLAGAIVYGTASLAVAGSRTRAVALAEEGVEALRSIRDADFDTLNNGTYGLSSSGSAWVLAGSQDVTGIYERQVTIAAAGLDRKNISSTVRWNVGGVERNVSVETELTNWRARFKSWVNAVLSGTYDAPGNSNGVSVAIRGNYAYIVRDGGSPNFMTIDISDPSNPTIAGSMALSGSPTDIVLDDTSAYVANSGNTIELQVVDISDPTNPSLQGSYNAPGNADGLSLAYSSGFVWLGRASSGGSAELVVLDVSSPGTPSVVYSYESGSAISDMAIKNNSIYAATDDNSKELMIIDFTVKTAPVVAGVLDLPSNTNATAIDIYNTTALVGQGDTLRAINVAVPSSPQLVGSYVSSGVVNDIAHNVSKEYAFLATGSATGELDIVALADLASLSSVRMVDVVGNTSLLGIAYSGEYDIIVGASASNDGEVVTFEPQ